MSTDHEQTASTAIDVAIGRRIRVLRRERKLSLDAVSSRTGLSIGFLSQIERGLSSPSVRVLATLADILGVTLAAIFSPASAADNASVVVRRGERNQLQLWRSGITKQLLTPNSPDGRLAVFLVELEPGASTGDELYSHQGEEAGLVLMGSMMLTVDEHTWLLSEGDSFRFASRRPHRFANPEDRPSSVIWVNSLPGPG